MNVIHSDVKVITFNVWGAILGPLSGDFRKARSEKYIELLQLKNIAAQDMSFRIIDVDQKADELSLRNGFAYGFVERFMLLTRMLQIDAFRAQNMLPKAYLINADTLKKYPPHLANPNLGDILRTLRSRNYLLGLFCNSGNNDSRQLIEILKYHGILSQFDSRLAFYSDVEGITIPHFPMFDKVIYDSGIEDLSHNNVLHVGVNRVLDYEGAKTAGFHALHYSPGATRLQEDMITTLSQLV